MNKPSHKTLKTNPAERRMNREVLGEVFKTSSFLKVSLQLTLSDKKTPASSSLP